MRLQENLFFFFFLTQVDWESHGKLKLAIGPGILNPLFNPQRLTKFSKC